MTIPKENPLTENVDNSHVTCEEKSDSCPVCNGEGRVKNVLETHAFSSAEIFSFRDCTSCKGIGKK